MPRAIVHRLPMAHPGDLSALATLFDAGALDPAGVVAVIGKTEGNGVANDFTRGYFTLAFATLMAERLGTASREAVLAGIPCVLSGGTEGVLSPHYLVFARVPDLARDPDAGARGDGEARLAVGVALSAPVRPEEIGRMAQVEAVAACVAAAMADAGIADPEEVHYVQVKAPCLTAARLDDAASRGAALVTTDAKRSMMLARIAGAYGVGLALGEVPRSAIGTGDALAEDPALFSTRASVSSGGEVLRNEVILLGNSPAWGGTLRVAHRPMADALDLAAIAGVLADVGVPAAPAMPPDAAARIRGVLVKCEPDRRRLVRGHRHTMLDDTDLDAQRHIRAAVGGVVAGMVGDGRIFVSGGAEHQGPDGGGLIAVIAEV